MIKRFSKVLVTGSAGFIGSRLVARLIERECDVTAVDHSQALTHSASGSGRRIIAGNLRDVLSRGEIKVAEYDFIMHLAGNSSVPKSILEPFSDFAASVETTMFLLEAMRADRARGLLIFPSSAAVYGEPQSMPIKEADPTVPISPYGVGKLACERYIDVYSKLYSLRSVCLRPFSVFGPEQGKQVVFDLIQKLTANPKMLNVIGDGKQQRDFIYVDDMIDLIFLCCALDLKPGQNEVFNAATGESTSISELVEKITAVMDLEPEIVYSGELRVGDPHSWRVDVSKAKAIGFTPQVSLGEGLKRVVTALNISGHKVAH